MNRPAPRRSPLAGRSALNHPPTPTETAEVSVTPVVEAPHLAPAVDTAVAVETPPAPTTPKAVKTAKAPKATPAEDTEKKEQLRGYMRPTQIKRLKNTVVHTRVYGPHRNLTEFVENAVLTAVAEFEQKYNNGQPFPEAPEGSLPPGRSL